MFDKLVERRIREAQEAGEFDDLEGAGRPLDLDAYFSAPEELRAGYALLKNAGIVPEEARLLAEVEELKRELEVCAVGSRRQDLKKAIEERLLRYNLLNEYYRRRRGRAS